MIPSQHYDQLHRKLDEAYREIKRLSNENLTLRADIERYERGLWEVSNKLEQSREELKKEWEKVATIIPINTKSYIEEYIDRRAKEEAVLDKKAQDAGFPDAESMEAFYHQMEKE